MMEWGTETWSERNVNERHPNSHASVVVGGNEGHVCAHEQPDIWSLGGNPHIRDTCGYVDSLGRIGQRERRNKNLGEPCERV